MATHEAYLRTALGKYQYADIAKRDILHAFQTYTDLRPKLDTFVFNDGSRKELLCLEGTIPVSYKGSTYNIPICLWLMDTHPYNPPMVYVKPTQTMQIKQGKHVDANGKIYLPYLHEWKHPTSDLLGLIQVLAIVFGEEPPVFSRSASRPQPPPYPAAGATPYPTTGSGMPVPGGYPSSTGYPPSTAGGYPSYPAYPQASGYPGGTNSQAGGYPAYPSYNPTATTATTQGNAAVANHTPTVSTQNSLSLSDEQIRASILSAVEDKMRRRLKDIFAQASAEMTALNRTQEDLQKGKNTLDEMMQKLEREQNEVERNITILTEKNEEIKNVLSRMENREEVDIDEAVVPTAPLYRQLLTTFAEEQATEDAIYYLHEGLKRGVIDLEVYLKQVRELSRKQYMCRALIARCRQKAGLPEL